MNNIRKLQQLRNTLVLTENGEYARLSDEVLLCAEEILHHKPELTVAQVITKARVQIRQRGFQPVL